MSDFSTLLSAVAELRRRLKGLYVIDIHPVTVSSVARQYGVSKDELIKLAKDIKDAEIRDEREKWRKKYYEVTTD